MAASETSTLGVPLNPLMKEETRVYVDQQKRADYFKNISQYLFWGATTIAGALAIGLITGGGLPGLALAGGAIHGGITLAVGALASIATFFGSVKFSRRATELSENSAVLYSDIDSQNQAHRMVQAFARAQNADVAQEQTLDTPYQASRGSWVARVTEQAQREDAQALASLRGGRGA